MNLQQRIDLLNRLGKYILEDNPSWLEAKEKAANENGWFIPEFITIASLSIANQFLQKDILEQWVAKELSLASPRKIRTVGVVMAGNIPLVGFHDWLSVFISGHKSAIKLSSKDSTLIKHLTETMAAWEPEVNQLITFSEMLKGCDAYIATGSNNSAGYFSYYFSKYPHIIRRSRTSVAILTGDESNDDLEKLADDVYLYFGRGCRNVTKIYVPRDYDFVPLLTVFKRYNWLADHHKYKNNYDYNLALHLLNKKFYMSNESLLLVEERSLFSPISQLNYQYYDKKEDILQVLEGNNELQCIVGKGFTPFGQSQSPSISDYADGINTLAFLTGG
jgi:hypothetical protein